MKNLKIRNGGHFEYRDNEGSSYGAEFPRWLIRIAWHRGCNFEKEADGYGPGMGTFGDWSGIRDSSDSAIEKMLQKAIIFLNLEK